MHRVLIFSLLFTQFCFSQLDQSESKTQKSGTSNYLTKGKSYDSAKLLSQAKRFFKDYIPTRLSELDEEGYASEYEGAREYHIGDINLDGIPDVVILYTVEGIGRTNNWARHILILTNNGEEISGYYEDEIYGKFQSDSKFLGIKDGYVIFKRYKPEFGGRQTEWKKIGIGVRNEKLVEIEISE